MDPQGNNKADEYWYPKDLQIGEVFAARSIVRLYQIIYILDPSEGRARVLFDDEWINTDITRIPKQRWERIIP
jgi:hypothetical protein